jgi:hypothetical protein
MYYLFVGGFTTTILRSVLGVYRTLRVWISVSFEDKIKRRILVDGITGIT